MKAKTDSLGGIQRNVLSSQGSIRSGKLKPWGLARDGKSNKERLSRYVMKGRAEKMWVLSDKKQEPGSSRIWRRLRLSAFFFSVFPIKGPDLPAQGTAGKGRECEMNCLVQQKFGFKAME